MYKLAASMRLAFRVIGYADVRSGILPAQSGSGRRPGRDDGDSF
jgi:hypothetical protein